MDDRPTPLLNEILAGFASYDHKRCDPLITFARQLERSNAELAKALLATLDLLRDGLWESYDRREDVRDAREEAITALRNAGVSHE